MRGGVQDARFEIQHDGQQFFGLLLEPGVQGVGQFCRKKPPVADAVHYIFGSGTDLADLNRVAQPGHGQNVPARSLLRGKDGMGPLRIPAGSVRQRVAQEVQHSPGHGNENLVVQRGSRGAVQHTDFGCQPRPLPPASPAFSIQDRDGVADGAVVPKPAGAGSRQAARATRAAKKIIGQPRQLGGKGDVGEAPGAFPRHPGFSGQGEPPLHVGVVARHKCGKQDRNSGGLGACETNNRRRKRPHQPRREPAAELQEQ